MAEEKCKKEKKLAKFGNSCNYNPKLMLTIHSNLPYNWLEMS